MKKEMRVIGIDDGPHEFHDARVLVVGAVCRGGESLDGLLSCSVDKDGDDATLTVAGMIDGSKFEPALQVIFLDGIAVGGFNIINILKLHELTRIPVIVIMRKEPDVQMMLHALEKAGMPHKKRLLEKLPAPIRHNDILFQCAGIDEAKAKEAITICTTRANIPEPIRLAHIIAGGIKDGQSRGRA
ncbi:MAG: DUF99 family protein [Nanoarchaeota archaeon]